MTRFGSVNWNGVQRSARVLRVRYDRISLEIPLRFPSKGPLDRPAGTQITAKPMTPDRLSGYGKDRLGG